MRDPKTCTHRTPSNIQRVNMGYDDYEDMQYVELGSQSTTEDIDTGRFRCTQCGLVMYYTGLWKNFYEKGIPCPGSESIKRK